MSITNDNLPILNVLCNKRFYRFFLIESVCVHYAVDKIFNRVCKLNFHYTLSCESSQFHIVPAKSAPED